MLIVGFYELFAFLFEAGLLLVYLKYMALDYVSVALGLTGLALG